MSKPKQVKPLLATALVLWLVELLVSVTVAPAPSPGSVAFAAAVANLAFWGGFLLAAAGLALMVPVWLREWQVERDTAPDPGQDFYA